MTGTSVSDEMGMRMGWNFSLNIISINNPTDINKVEKSAIACHFYIGLNDQFSKITTANSEGFSLAIPKIHTSIFYDRK